MALSLCVNPMPSRITRKSTRPRVADRTMVDTVQPQALASFRNRSALSLLMKMQLLRWNKAKPKPKARLKTGASLISDKGLDAANHHRASGGQTRMFLTSPLSPKTLFKRESPRPGVQVWRLFFGVIGFVVGGIFPHSTQSLYPRMFDRTSACDRQVGRVDEP